MFGTIGALLAGGSIYLDYDVEQKLKNQSYSQNRIVAHSFNESDVRYLIANSDQAELFDAMSEHFELEFDILVKMILQVPQNKLGDETYLSLIFDNFHSEFDNANRRYLLSAPTTDLARLADRHAEFWKTLQDTSSLACLAAINGDTSNASLFRAYKKEILKFSTLKLRAMAAGRDFPTSRTTATEDEVVELIMKNLTASVGAQPTLEEIETMTPAEECELTVTIYEYVSNLPDEESAFWYLSLEQ